MSRTCPGDPKLQAKIIKSFLAEKEIEMKLGHCYELLSKIHGFENWDTYCAVLKRGKDVTH